MTKSNTSSPTTRDPHRFEELLFKFSLLLEGLLLAYLIAQMHQEFQARSKWVGWVLGGLVAGSANINLYLAIKVFDAKNGSRLMEFLERIARWLVLFLNGKLLYLLGVFTLIWHSAKGYALKSPDWYLGVVKIAFCSSSFVIFLLVTVWDYLDWQSNENNLPPNLRNSRFTFFLIFDFFALIIFGSLCVLSLTHIGGRSPDWIGDLLQALLLLAVTYFILVTIRVVKPDLANSLMGNSEPDNRNVENS